MELAKIFEDGRLVLPADIIKRFSPLDQFVVAVEGNTILLSKVQLPKLSEIAEKLEGIGEEITMEEIVNEVHQYRLEKKGIE